MITNLQYIMLNMQEKDVKLFDMPDTEELLLDMQPAQMLVTASTREDDNTRIKYNYSECSADMHSTFSIKSSKCVFLLYIIDIK